MSLIPPTLAAIAEDLAARGLRPIVDVAIEIVVADCPDCHAQDTDLLGLWRPLQVVPRPGSVTYACTACGAVEGLRV